MPILSLFITILLWSCFLCAVLLLYLMRNGRTRHLGGLRLCLRFYACVPILGLVLNIFDNNQMMPERDFVLLRRVIQYGMLNISVGSFLWWLWRRPLHPANKA